MVALIRITHYWLETLFCVMGLLPIPRMPRPIDFLYRVLWCLWCGQYIISMSLEVSAARWEMSFFVGCLLFIVNAATDILTIGESFIQHGEYLRLRQLQAEIDELLERLLQPDLSDAAAVSGDSRFLCNIWPLLLLQIGCDLVKTCIALFAVVTGIYWEYLPIELVLRVRYVQILVQIMKLNQRVGLLTKGLHQLAARNEDARSLADAWQPYTAWEFEQLNTLRLIYGRLYKAYMALNRCFGWSILFIFLSAFLDFVCNAFWCLNTTGWNVMLYNGCTTLIFGSLVAAMFVYTDASANSSHAAIMLEEFIALVKSFLRQQSSVLASHEITWRLRVALYVIGLVEFALRFYGLLPLGGIALLNAGYTSCWLLQVGAVVYLSYRLPGPQRSANELQLLSDVVHTLLFISKIVAHLIILLDSSPALRHLLSRGGQQQRELREMRQQLELVRRYFIEKATLPLKRAQLAWQLGRRLLFMMAVLFCCHSIIMWAWLHRGGGINIAIFYYCLSLPSTCALQTKAIGLFIPLTALNGYADLVQRTLNTHGRRNVQRVFFTALALKRQQSASLLLVAALPQQPRRPLAHAIVQDKMAVTNGNNNNDEEAEDVDLEQLQMLKRIYCEMHVVFGLFNRSNGWSLLAYTAMAFIELVCNSYWLILALITDTDSATFMQDIALLVVAAVPLVMLCWLSQSRAIGCLCYKLVKPLGNKRYNDLVTEFSLQVLHQRFIITAKEFFSFNLNLLGKMVAAIVTYLVILLQFMFTEKNVIETTASGSLNATSVKRN